jgi:hypothetical protein
VGCFTLAKPVPSQAGHFVSAIASDLSNFINLAPKRTTVPRVLGSYTNAKPMEGEPVAPAVVWPHDIEPVWSKE